MRYLGLLFLMLFVACDGTADRQGQDTDCRQARYECANGFICTDMGDDVFACIAAQNGGDSALESDAVAMTDVGPASDAGSPTDAAVSSDGEAVLADSGIAAPDAATDMGQDRCWRRRDIGSGVS